MALKQDWPYWLTQGEGGFDPTSLGEAPLNIMQGAQPTAPAQAPVPLGAPNGTPGMGDPLADSIGTSLPPGMNMTPPKDEAEVVVRKQGWLAAIQKMFTDPVLGDTLMRVGLQMMQPIKPGQTVGGHVAGAIMGGADYKTGRESAVVKEGRESAESKSKIGLQDAQAEYYRKTKGKTSASGGGGTAAEVQKVNQIAAALRAGDPEYYAANPGKDILDAREALDAVKREAIAAGLARGQILPGTDADATVRGAVGQAKDIKAGVAGNRETGKGKAPGHVIPPEAKTGTDKKTGKKVYTLDGKVFFDAETGKEVK